MSAITLSRHILEHQIEFPEAKGRFTELLILIATAAKIVSYEVNKAGLLDVASLVGSENIHGEEVKQLDLRAENVFINTLAPSGLLCAMASEESEEIIKIPKEFKKGKYIFLFDPLDGSSNIDANVSIGTIFSIHTKKNKDDLSLDDCFQKGKDQVCAGYVIYGSSTMLVYTSGAGVHGFTLDPAVGEFFLSHPNMKFPEKEKSKNDIAVNNGCYNLWDVPTKQFINEKLQPKSGLRGYTHRYIGSLVADFHRNLLHGGFYIYPDQFKDGKRSSKLRLLYEAAPLAFIAEQAGGYASNGQKSILEIKASEIHERVQLIIGSKYDVLEYDQAIKTYNDPN